MSEMHPLTEAIISGNRDRALALTQECLDAGEEASFIVENRLVPGMAIVGEQFSNNEIYIPEMLIAARAMKESLKLLEPLLADAGVRPAYTAVIGTVEGDLHDIGKNLVAMMWRGANIGVIDLGVNVPARVFVTAIEEHKPDLVGMSALLTTTMPAMRGVVAAIKATGLPVKVVIGGAPVTEEFAREVGADGFALDAGSAVDVALSLVRETV
jgi:5-methyltetrahydrofolate--homocysteine methyltransferase